MSADAPPPPTTTDTIHDRVAAWLVPLLYGLTFATIALRLVVIRYATEASDDHMAPLDFIFASGRLPRLRDCFECYHPKLFYVLQADFFRGFSIIDRLTRLQMAALLDWLAVGVMAFALWVFLRWQRLSQLQRAVCFAVPVSAPGITLVCTQPSNDGLVIGLSSVAIVAYWRWSGQRTARWLALAIAAASLAAATKGSGLVVLAGVLAGALVQPLRFWRGQKKQAALLVVAGAAGVGFVAISGYYANWADTGNVLAVNVARSPVAPFFPSVKRGDAGVNSIVEAYFDFPILSELKVPLIGYSETTEAPAHRSNLWTMMHGNHLYSRFLQWPGSWNSTEAFTVDVGRCEVTLGLVPLALLVWGMLRRLRSHARVLARLGARRVVIDREVWLTGTVVVTLAMLVKLSSEYRWAASMKAFYAYPVIIGFAACLVEGVASVRRRWLESGVALVASALVGLHVIDVTLLGVDLSRSFGGRAWPLAGMRSTLRDGEVDLVKPLAEAKILSGKVKALAASNGEVSFCDRALDERVLGATSPSDVELKLDGSKTRLRVAGCNAARAPRTGTGIRFQLLGAGVEKLRFVVVTLDRSPEDNAVWIEPTLR
jgi:hypothetical protein